MTSLQNLFAAIPEGAGESLETITETEGVRVERIVSRGAASPEGFWYDQEADEWVLLAQGEATLEFEDGFLKMKAGDHLMIPRHKRHRVLKTSTDAVWLAVHWKSVNA